jgi:hypothetical protein
VVPEGRHAAVLLVVVARRLPVALAAALRVLDRDRPARLLAVDARHDQDAVARHGGVDGLLDVLVLAALQLAQAPVALAARREDLPDPPGRVRLAHDPGGAGGSVLRSRRQRVIGEERGPLGMAERGRRSEERQRDNGNGEH